MMEMPAARAVPAKTRSPRPRWGFSCVTVADTVLLSFSRSRAAARFGPPHGRVTR